MSTLHDILGMALWWYLILGAVFLVTDWEYGDDQSFAKRLARSWTRTYGSYAGIWLDAMTLFGAVIIWPRIAWHRWKEIRPAREE